MLFGSGELTATGRAIHEYLFRVSGLMPPVNIGILETPTGFEVNALHSWPERTEKFFTDHLRNYQPRVRRIRAWRKDGPNSTNDPEIAYLLRNQDYIYCGAGSPSYTVRHLIHSAVYREMTKAHRSGTTLSLGSASAVAIGAYALPVYEIYKCGMDPFWMRGLNFFGRYGFSLAIVPHWDNAEGEDFDTTCCWMGKERFRRLRALLPPDVTVLGIDELTACIVGIVEEQMEIRGRGNIHIMRGTAYRRIGSGESVSWDLLR